MQIDLKLPFMKRNKIFAFLIVGTEKTIDETNQSESMEEMPKLPHTNRCMSSDCVFFRIHMWLYVIRHPSYSNGSNIRAINVDTMMMVCIREMKSIVTILNSVANDTVTVSSWNPQITRKLCFFFSPPLCRCSEELNLLWNKLWDKSNYRPTHKLLKTPHGNTQSAKKKPKSPSNLTSYYLLPISLKSLQAARILVLCGL